MFPSRLAAESKWMSQLVLELDDNFLGGFLEFFWKTRDWYFFFLNWSIVDLQCRANLCCTAKCLRYTYIYFLVLNVLFHYGLSQDIQYGSLYCTAGPCLSILNVVVCIYQPQTPSTYLIIETSLALFCIFLVMQMNIQSSDLGLNCCSITELKLIWNRNLKTKEYFLFFDYFHFIGKNLKEFPPWVSAVSFLKYANNVFLQWCSHHLGEWDQSCTWEVRSDY